MTQTWQPQSGPPQGPQSWQQGAPSQGWQQPAPQQSGPPAQGQQPWQQTPQAPPAGPPQSQQPQPDEDGDDEFFTSGTGGKYMSFADDSCIGYERGGEIVGLGERQQTDQETKQPMFWPNSDRKIMIKVVTLQTQERVPNDPEDTGLRSIWLPQSKDVTKAVTDAMRAANTGEIRLRIGGQLWVTRTGSRQTTQKNGQRGFPAYTYTARYVPPPAGTRNDAFFAGPPANGQAPAQTAPPQQGVPAQGPPQQNQTPWQQGPPPQQGNPYAAGPNGTPPANNGWQQGPPPQSPQGPPQQGWQQPGPQAGPPAWGQQGSPQGQQGGYQPQPPDPANPWGNQQGVPPQGSWQQGPPQGQQQYPQQ